MTIYFNKKFQNPKLEIIDLTKQYGAFTALDHINVIFSPGIYGVLGANGAGKSTMMNLIADTMPRTEGKILFHGVDVLDQGRSFRKILGYMPQHQGFYESMTARSFLIYMSRLKGIHRRTAERQITKLLTFLNLLDVQHRNVSALSGGMRQRVLLAQALLGNPQILLLDEPTAGLDQKERIRLREFIAHIAREKIVLITTHVLSDVESIASEILLMKSGQLIRMDRPEILLEELRKKGVPPVGNTLSLEDVYLYYSN